MVQTQANEGFDVSRGTKNRTWRPLTVWLAVTTAAGASAGAVPGAWRAAPPAAGSAATVDEVVVAVCATGLAVGLAWLWVITTTTALALLTGRRVRGGGAVRRLVLAACGVAVVAGIGAPAVAADHHGPGVLAGLPLPERAVAPPASAPPAPAPPDAAPTDTRRPVVADASDGRDARTPAMHVVRAGDSLWAVAQTHPRAGAGTAQRWQELWRANREVVGDDPDLILPGQALRLPGTTTEPTRENGDR